MNRNIIVSPSVLSADFSNMKEDIGKINNSKAEFIHFDVMDGSFVPVITFGHKMIKDIRPLSSKIFDVHLMVEKPENHILSIADAGADYITFHVEATTHVHRVISQIKALGKKAGISLVPSSPIAFIEEVLPFVDLVLVMSVNPGFGGQELIPEVLHKIEKIDAIRKEKNYNFLIEIDGGVNLETYKAVIAAGTDVLVAGSAFFNASDPEAFVSALIGK